MAPYFIMQHITTLTEYCQFIHIPPPRDEHFDIRRFADTMQTVNQHQPPFRHEFYSIALRLNGTNRQVNGQPVAANLFFNTPYQVISWDIEPDWEGGYVMFTEDFVRANPTWTNFMTDFPFLMLDKSVPFDVPEADVDFINIVFAKIHAEYESDHADRLSFIRAYTQLLLLNVRRCYDRVADTLPASQDNRAADVRLVAQMQTRLSRSLADANVGDQARHPSFYADQLNIHPNHLNAVVKRVTGKTASQLVQEGVITAAKSLLQTTDLSVKEVSYQLHFSEPTHFVGFFKKLTGQTPHQFRENGLR